MTKYLIIGGAGYIGSHVVQRLLMHGQEVVVLDDLSRGHAEAISSAELVIGNFGDPVLLGNIFANTNFDCIMHFAALSIVPESIKNPLLYYKNNVGNTITLLSMMKKYGINNFIFSSSASVYGDPVFFPIKEKAKTNPTHPYGRSKLNVENILADVAATSDLKFVSLRYFNAAGAEIVATIGEDHKPETHLIPIVLQAALGQRESVEIFGTDWNTPDKTCIRDYIHVWDLARAHMQAAEYLLDGGKSEIFNLGSENGSSVRQVIDIAKKITGRDIKVVESPRREGDPEKLVASSKLIKGVLDWHADFTDLERIIDTAWRWHESHPNGYDGRK